MEWTPLNKMPKKTIYLEPIITASRSGKAYLSLAAEDLLDTPDEVVFLSDGNGRRAVRRATPADPEAVRRSIDPHRTVTIAPSMLPRGCYRLEGDGPIYEMVLTDRPKRGKNTQASGHPWRD